MEVLLELPCLLCHLGVSYPRPSVQKTFKSLEKPPGTKPIEIPSGPQRSCHLLREAQERTEAGQWLCCKTGELQSQEKLSVDVCVTRRSPKSLTIFQCSADLEAGLVVTLEGTVVRET